MTILGVLVIGGIELTTVIFRCLVEETVTLGGDRMSEMLAIQDSMRGVVVLRLLE